MTPFDLAFIVGPLGSPVIGILVIVVLVVNRPASWSLWLGIPLLGLTAIAWLAYWLLWGKSFDRVDAGLDPRTTVDVAMNAAVWVCAAGCVALVATAVSVLWSTRRRGTAAVDVPSR